MEEFTVYESTKVINEKAIILNCKGKEYLISAAWDFKNLPSGFHEIALKIIDKTQVVYINI